MKLSDLFFWKHKEEEHVIEQKCYDKLPEKRKEKYIPYVPKMSSKTKPVATHIVEHVDRTSDSDDGIILTALALAALSNDNSSNTAFDDNSQAVSSNDNDFQGFGGGDSGGAGASDSWSSDSSSSSSDSSYDSSSSSDSSYDSSSSDSSSSSSDF